MLETNTAHHTVTVSSPSRWFCGMASALPLLLPDSTLLLWCWLFFFVFFICLFSSPVVHITWIPWVSLVKSTLLRNGVRNQSINHSLSLSVCLSLSSHHTLQFGGWFCVLSQDKQLFLCLSKAFGSLQDLVCPVEWQW